MEKVFVICVLMNAVLSKLMFLETDNLEARASEVNQLFGSFYVDSEGYIYQTNDQITHLMSELEDLKGMMGEGDTVQLLGQSYDSQGVDGIISNLSVTAEKTSGGDYVLKLDQQHNESYVTTSEYEQLISS